MTKKKADHTSPIEPTPTQPQDIASLLGRRAKPVSDTIVKDRPAVLPPKSTPATGGEPAIIEAASAPKASAPAAPAAQEPAKASNRRGRRPQTAAAKQAAAQARGSEGQSKTPQMTVNVAARTRALLNSLRSHTPFNNTENALRALDISDERAAAIVTQHHERKRAAYEQSMGLSRFQAPHAAKTPTRKVPLGVGFDYQMQEVVDQIVAASGATGRGDLFDACIVAYAESLGLEPDILAPADLY